MVVEPIFTVGDETAKDGVLVGGVCDECGLQFVNDEVRDAWADTEVDPSQYEIDRKI